MSKRLVSPKMRVKDKARTWKTKGGNFLTSHTAKVDFILPELDPTKIVTWKCHVDDSDDPNPRYDVIIGRDLLSELGMLIDFKNFCVKCEGGAYDGCTAPMVDLNEYTFTEGERLLNTLEDELHESEISREATDRT